MMWTLMVSAAVGWAFAVYSMVAARKEAAAQRSWFQGQLDDGRGREQQLLDQIQLNTQHLPYYPQVGPFPPVEEKRFLHSEDGLISFEDLDDQAVAAAMDEVAGV